KAVTEEPVPGTNAIVEDNSAAAELHGVNRSEAAGPSHAHMTKPTATESTAMSHSAATHSAAAMSAAAMSAAATGRHDPRRTAGNNGPRGQCDHHPTHHSPPPLPATTTAASTKTAPPVVSKDAPSTRVENLCSILSRSRKPIRNRRSTRNTQITNASV